MTHRVMLAADMVKMDLSDKALRMHGARIIASFLPRWCVFRLPRHACFLKARFRVLQSAPSSDAHKPRNSRISLSVGFFSTPLTDLDLHYNGIGVEGAKAIAAALPR